MTKNGRCILRRLPLYVVILAAAFTVPFSGCDGGSGGTDLTDQLLLNRPQGIVQLDLASGDEQVLIVPPENNILVEPAVSKDGTQIAYVGLLGAVVTPGQKTDLGSDLYVAAADGSNPRMVAEHAVRGEQLHSPAWLPDGNVLIYAQRFEDRRIVVNIERVNVETGERSVIVRNGYAPGPSPDGTKVVFIRPEPDLTVSLWRANIDGTNEERLLAESDLVSFNDPRYSPDGLSIALGAAGPGESLRVPDGAPAQVSLRGLNPALRSDRDMNGLPEDVWLIDARTMEATRLADLDLDQPTVAWSGDGQRLFALGDRGLYYIDQLGGGEEQIGQGMYHGQLDWLAAEQRLTP